MNPRPTIRAVLLVALGFPLALLPSLVAQDLWYVVVVFNVLVILLFVADYLWSPARNDLKFECDAPTNIFLGEKSQIVLSVHDDTGWGRTFEALPSSSGPLAQLGLETLERDASDWSHEFAVVPDRRGTIDLHDVWLRWTGPLGLIARASRIALNQPIAVVPNVRAVRQAALRLNQHQTYLSGLKVRRFLGDGSEFDALRQYLPGLDHRQIDWKATARHRRLLTRENRAERNHRIMLAFDTGRLMSEPIEDIPRLDHAVNAGLLLAYLSLKIGDQVGAFAFDSEARSYVAPQPGVNSIHHLMKMASGLEYSNHETNYTLGVLELSKRLSRRSVVIVLTDFTDTIGAELMVENLQYLARKHVVVFVAIRDPEMKSIIQHRPADLLDVHRAIVANDLEKERSRVIQGLRKKGIFCVDALPGEINVELLNRYLDIHRRELV